MTSPKGPAIYVPSDKNIYDALHHKKATHAELRKFLARKGILASPLAHKDHLISKISRIPFGYDDFKYLTELLENPNRKEKITRTCIKSESNSEELIAVAEQIKSDLFSSGESLTINKTKHGIFLRTSYVDVDFTKTELRQRQKKTCEIEVEIEGSEIVIRRPASTKGEEISELFRKKLSEKQDKKLVEEIISLESINNPAYRSQFFDLLTNSIEGYVIFDVIDVNVHHIDAESTPDKEECTDGDEDQDSDVETPTNIASHIRKAALSGKGVLESEEFGQLHSKGFYISKIIWIAEDEIPGGERIELEAEFGDPIKCRAFKYLVRGIYKYNDQRSSHNVTKRTPSRDELRKYNPLMERAAKIAEQKVFATLPSENEDEKQMA